MDRHPDAQPSTFVASDSLHISQNFSPELLHNQKLHSFLAIQLATLYQTYNTF